MKYFYNLNRNVDRLMCASVLILAVISVLMIGSTTVDSTGFFSRSVIVQIAAYIMGLVCIFIIFKINYTLFEGFEKQLYVLSLILLATVYIPGLGIEQFSSRAWIDLGFTTVQPSEIVKILYILILAGYFKTHQDELYNFKGLLKSALVAAPIIVIVLKEDLGSALVFAAIWVVMVFYAGIEIKVFAKFFALVLAVIPVAYIFMADYQKDRIEAFLHPDNLDLPGNYQVWQSKVAIGSGGFFGKGLFNGTQKELDYIPVQTSDFIFSVIGEELGFLGGLAIIAIYTLFLIRLMKVVHNASDFYGALIVTGILGMFAFQIFENIAMTMGLMPVTGITLPFMSYGGSSILSNMIALGFALNVGAGSKKIRF